MQQLINSPGFAPAIIALIVAITAYIKQATQNSYNKGKTEGLQKQVDNLQQQTTTPTVIPVVPPVPVLQGRGHEHPGPVNGDSTPT